MDADFCADALKEAITKYSKPEIMNMEHLSAIGSSECATTGAVLYCRQLVTRYLDFGDANRSRKCFSIHRMNHKLQNVGIPKIYAFRVTKPLFAINRQ